MSTEHLAPAYANPRVRVTAEYGEDNPYIPNRVEVEIDVQDVGLPDICGVIEQLTRVAAATPPPLAAPNGHNVMSFERT